MNILGVNELYDFGKANLRRCRWLAQSFKWRSVGSLRRLMSGGYQQGPEVIELTSVCLRISPEVFGFASGGLSEVAEGLKYGEFSMVLIFCRRFCGVLYHLTPDICKAINYCQDCISGNLRGFGVVTSGASVILKIRILSRV